MPMFKYACDDCQQRFEELVFGAESEISCPSCQSKSVQKQLSRVSASVSGSGADVNCGQPACPGRFT